MSITTAVFRIPRNMELCKTRQHYYILQWKDRFMEGIQPALRVQRWRKHYLLNCGQVAQQFWPRIPARKETNKTQTTPAFLLASQGLVQPCHLYFNTNGFHSNYYSWLP